MAQAQTDAERDLLAYFNTDSAIVEARDELLRYVALPEDRDELREIADRAIESSGRETTADRLTVELDVRGRELETVEVADAR